MVKVFILLYYYFSCVYYKLTQVDLALLVNCRKFSCNFVEKKKHKNLLKCVKYIIITQLMEKVCQAKYTHHNSESQCGESESTNSGRYQRSQLHKAQNRNRI